jgi:membrane associated rhomboid family serine protease
MIIPIGHEQTTVRRLPWVTFSIMGLCLVVFLFTNPGEKARQEEAFEELGEAFEYFGERPYLVMDERLRDALVQEFGEQETNALLQMMRQAGPDPPTNSDQLQREQETFEGMVDDFFASVDSSPLRALGVVPADMSAHTLISYQFAHAGWGHLLGNLFMLFLAGPFVEDRWGRPMYAAFYLFTGILAALMFVVRYPSLNVPLVGASGAIAGLMGAFLILFWNTKIKFLYWLFFFMVGTFEAPAWLMLPLWFVKELFFANAMDSLAPGEGGGGVAFWAHVWGFIFGVVITVAIVYFRVEERFIHKKIEDKITLVENPTVEDASKLAEGGDRTAAKDALTKELDSRPDNIDAAIALWNLCFQDGEMATAMPHMLRAIRHAARTGDHQFVTTHWLEVLDSEYEVQLEPALGLRIAEMQRDESQIEAADATLDLVAQRVDGSTPAGVLLRLTRLAIEIGSPQTAGFASAALANPELPPEVREELEPYDTGPPATMDGDGPPTDTDGESEEEEDQPIVHSIVAKRVVPRRIDGLTLEVELDGEKRAVDLAAIQVISVCGIARSAQKPVILVDLLLDSPWGDRPQIRVIRMTSDTFDPRRLIGGEDGMAAFQTFLERLFEASDAVPLPDPDAARGKPFRSFSTTEAYEQEVLGIG